MELCLIVNTKAGNGLPVTALNAVEKRFKERGVMYTVYNTEYQGHATDLAKQAAGSKRFDCIVSIGGDGTVREVALGLMYSDAVMGIIPCGSGNDFVRPLGIPTDYLTAADILVDGDTICIDAGKANDEVFFNVAGFGFDVDVLDNVELYKYKMKNGRLAYIMGLLRAVLGLKSRDVSITLPDGRLIKRKALMVAAGNGTHIGSGMEIAPYADLRDGLLEISIIHDVTKLNAIYALPRFLNGKLFGTKYTTSLKVEEFTADCEPHSRIQVDGERMEGTPVTFKILPKALNIRVPKGKFEQR